MGCISNTLFDFAVTDKLKEWKGKKDRRQLINVITELDKKYGEGKRTRRQIRDLLRYQENKEKI